MCVAALMLVPREADAQGFLKKMKEKAGKALDKVAGKEESAGDDADAAESDDLPATPTAIDRLPKLHRSTVVWNGEVQPSKAANPRALLNELPALLTVEQLVDPDDAVFSVYNRQLSALSLRVDELDEEYSCSDEEMLAARENLYKELQDLTGLTPEEMKIFDDPNTPEAEKQRLEEKMRNHVLGGTSPEDISAKAQSMEGRAEELAKEMKIYEEKEKNGTLTEADKKRMMEISQEAMAMHQELMGAGLGNMMDVANKGQVLQDKLVNENAELERRLKVFANKAAALRKSEEGVVKSCGEIAKEYETKLKNIYQQIWAESDADKIHALYDQADELMKNYRTRAAQIHRKSLQVRLENTKKLMPEAESLYTEMAEDGMIPTCATRRAPLNVVMNCIDILHEAYADFPQPQVLCVEREVISILKPEEHLFFPESGFAGGFGSGGNLADDFLKGSHILVVNSNDGCYFEIDGGVRRNLGEDGLNAYKPKAVHPAESSYGDIPMRKGSRKAVYNRSGSLILHDGTSFYPLVMQRHADRLEFIIYGTINPDDRNGKDGFIKCTYKL